MKVQTQTVTPVTDPEIDSTNQTTVVPAAPLPKVDEKSRDQVLSEIAEDSLVSPQDYLRDSVACIGE